MFYEVDTERIDNQLSYLETCSRVLDETAPRLRAEEDVTSFFAASRALHIAVECVIDAGDAIIDGFIMRDPGGYLDIVDILEDEGVVPGTGARRLKELIRVRDRLVRRYVEVDRAELAREAADASVFRDFAGWVKAYLKQELGSAHPERGGLDG